MLLHHAFESAAEQFAAKVAVVSGDERVSYDELRQRARGLAHELREEGIAPGDRVLTLLDNGVEFAVAVQAVLALGAVLVPVSALAKADKVAFIARDSGARALLTHAQLAPSWQPVLQAATGLHAVWVAGEAIAALQPAVRRWPHAVARACPEPERDADDLALLVYTSGTTGIPKGVMLTHGSLLSVWSSIQAWLDLRPNDVIGLALPTAFTYGLTNLMMGLAVGATVVLDRWAAFPVRLAQTLARERVTMFPGVPTLFASLLGLSDLAGFDWSALRLVTNAAAALPESHVRRLRAVWPAAELILMYGMTECIRASYLPPEEVDARPTSVGRGIASQAHWLIDEGGRILPPGSTGELVVAGPHVMQGYWERPGETAERLSTGADGRRCFRTGDIFRSDADSFLYFVSRKDDINKTRGEKVAPREVENAIYQLDGVTGCAVVGVADEALGQLVKAYVTLRPGSALDERAIARHCMARLESYMVPKRVEIVGDLPRTESGKIRHASLR
jgi:amino acid adenylation domain-containing protein